MKEASTAGAITKIGVQRFSLSQKEFPPAMAAYPALLNGPPSVRETAAERVFRGR